MVDQDDDSCSGVLVSTRHDTATIEAMACQGDDDSVVAIVRMMEEEWHSQQKHPSSLSDFISLLVSLPHSNFQFYDRRMMTMMIRCQFSQRILDNNVPDSDSRRHVCVSLSKNWTEGKEGTKIFPMGCMCVSHSRP